MKEIKTEFTFDNSQHELIVDQTLNIDKFVDMLENYIILTDKEKLKKEIKDIYDNTKLSKNKDGNWIVEGNVKEISLNVMKVVYENAQKKVVNG